MNENQQLEELAAIVNQIAAEDIAAGRFKPRDENQEIELVGPLADLIAAEEQALPEGWTVTTAGTYRLLTQMPPLTNTGTAERSFLTWLQESSAATHPAFTRVFDDADLVRQHGMRPAVPAVPQSVRQLFDIQEEPPPFDHFL